MSIVLHVNSLYLYQTVLSVPYMAPKVSNSLFSIMYEEDEYLLLYVPYRLVSMSLDSPNSLTIS